MAACSKRVNCVHILSVTKCFLEFALKLVYIRCNSAVLLFQEFEDNFDDEIDFTPPAEDTPSVQSPAEVFTLSVPNISLPAPSQFQPSAGKTLGPHVVFSRAVSEK